MNSPMKLREIVEALSLQMDETRQYLNIDSGEIELITDDDL